MALLAVAAAGGLMDWGSAGGLTGSVSAKPPGLKGPKEKGPKGKAPLQKAYEALTEVSVWTETSRERPSRDVARLLEPAKELYRAAVRSSRDGEGRRADELAAASHDAARGLLHALRADAPAVRGLPRPPRDEDDELNELLRRTRERLDIAASPPRGPGASSSTPRAGSMTRRAGRATRTPNGASS
jgi:hypothetical protein